MAGERDSRRGHSYLALVAAAHGDVPTDPCRAGRGRPGLDVLPHYELHANVNVPTEVRATGDAWATLDLGQIHQAAVTTSSGKGLIVSGRGIRSVKRDMNKMHGEISRKQKRGKKGSRLWWKLQHACNQRASRCERRVCDLRHKGTRQVIDFCKLHEVGTIYIGNPDGVRRKNCGRHHNQRMSQ